MRAVVDKRQVKSSSTTKMSILLREIRDNGGTIKKRSPSGGMFSIQHEKTWIFDRSVYLCGSLNATHNSSTYCEEAAVVTRVASVVTKATTHFEELWAKSEDLTEDDYHRRPKSRSATTDTED